MPTARIFGRQLVHDWRDDAGHKMRRLFNGHLPTAILSGMKLSSQPHHPHSAGSSAGFERTCGLYGRRRRKKKELDEWDALPYFSRKSEKFLSIGG